MKKMMLTLIVVAFVMAIVPAFADKGAGTTDPTNNNTAGAGTSSIATMDVNLSVEPYAEVTWGAASIALKVMPPTAGRVYAHPTSGNYDFVNLSVASNCNVNLTIQEGLGQWVIDQFQAQHGAAAAAAIKLGTWGQGSFSGGTPDWGKLVFAPGIQMYRTETKPDTYGFDGADLGSSLENATNSDLGKDLPGGGHGVGITIPMVYNGNIETTSGGPVAYDGRITRPVGIMLQTSPGSVTGTDGEPYDWTKLAASTTGSPKVYATIAIP